MLLITPTPSRELLPLESRVAFVNETVPAISELSRNGAHGGLHALPLLPTSAVSICTRSVVQGGGLGLCGYKSYHQRSAKPLYNCHLRDWHSIKWTRHVFLPCGSGNPEPLEMNPYIKVTVSHHTLARIPLSFIHTASLNSSPVFWACHVAMVRVFEVFL